ncbi:hypothetical protein ABT158_27470 [Nonomuraea sp. NPDC001636]|uniref:hypothetical protein n=1 Tax=Nonomuraea sp. NPDC001636 TaxID=3154391 RepID=UPI0033207F09
MSSSAGIRQTSAIGKALARGVGLRRQRCEDLVGLKVVLTVGELELRHPCAPALPAGPWRPR